MLTIADVAERDLIGRIRSRLTLPPASWITVGIGDDAAVVENDRNQLQVLTTDTIVDGVHFDRAFTPADAIGHRALAVNLSDLAAMGAKPRLALLSMALPPTLALDDFDTIAEAFGVLAATHQTQVVGGNLTRTPGPLAIDVTAVGSARRRHVLTRAGARAGDELYVTGHLGSARAGLGYLQATSRDGTRALDRQLEAAVRGYLYPQPRVRAGVLVARNRAASACMDLSDGLADAVIQVTTASGIGATLAPATFPIDDGARTWFVRRGLDAVSEALAGGDDYELLFAVPRRVRRSFVAAMRLSATPVAKIGVCTPETGVRLEGIDAAFTSTGFRHFR